MFGMEILDKSSKDPQDNIGFILKGNTHLNISKRKFCPVGMAPSERTRSIRAGRDTLVADYSMPGLNTTHRVAYRPQIAVSPFLHALSVSDFERTLWCCGPL
jgi:hypothetical protein